MHAYFNNRCVAVPSRILLRLLPMLVHVIGVEEIRMIPLRRYNPEFD